MDTAGGGQNEVKDCLKLQGVHRRALVNRPEEFSEAAIEVGIWVLTGESSWDRGRDSTRAGVTESPCGHQQV
jgi:hypothetical protein